jgi:HAAS
MGGHRLTPQAGTHAQGRVDAYLGELARLLRGPRRRRARILAELRDGLDQAIAEHTTHGHTEDQAVESAIDHFGTPQAVADAFAGELVTAYARHTIAWYIATGPLVGIWWLLLLQPHPWRAGLVAVLAAIPILPLIAVAIATAAGTFATTGRLIRWLPEAGPVPALSATMAIAALALAGDLAVITFYLRSGAAVRPLAIAAIGASLIRIACSTVILRHATLMRRGSTRLGPEPGGTERHDAHR